MKVSKLSTVLPLFFALISLMSMTADAKIFSTISIGGNSYQALVDSGAGISIVPPEKIKPGMLIEQTRTGIFEMANGDKVRANIYSAKISIGGYPPQIIDIAVLPGSDPIIGLTTLKAFGAIIDTSSGSLKFPAKEGFQSRPAFQYAPRNNGINTRHQRASKPYVESRYQGEVSPGC